MSGYDKRGQCRFVGTVMNVRTGFSDMHGGGDVFTAIFVCLQGYFYKLIPPLQRFPDLLLTVMKSADGNAVSLAPASHAQPTAAALLDLTRPLRKIAVFLDNSEPL